MIDIRFRRLRDQAVEPRRMTEHAAGYDLASCHDEPLVIAPGRLSPIPTGLSIELPTGYEAQIRPRSGLALKHRIGVLNAPGTIDADYRGEIMVLLYNFGDSDFIVEPGTRIAQMVIARHETVQFVESDRLGDTLRGEGGFGHTAQ